MNIKRIRDIFKRDREVSLRDLALETGESVEDIQYILEDWIARERIKAVKELPFCASKGCSGCSAVSAGYSHLLKRSIDGYRVFSFYQSTNINTANFAVTIFFIIVDFFEVYCKILFLVRRYNRNRT